MTWGIDLAEGGAALAITILFNHDQRVHYISGRAIHRACESYRGEGKTNAKDAAVIADQTRIRRDLHPLRTSDETVTDLKILTGRHTDLIADRTRTVNRLRVQLTDIFPGLERALDLTNTDPLTLLTGYQTPASLRRTGKNRLEAWLRNRKVLRADRLAETAVEAAGRQHTRLPGEKLTAQMVHTLAREVMALNHQVAELDKTIEARFREHRDFDVVTRMPGLGVILGAEFLAATGGDMTRLRHRRPSRRLRRRRTRTPRLRQDQRQSPSATTLQPPPPTRLLHLRTVQHPSLRLIPPVLRTQTSRRQAPHLGRPRPGPPPGQRPLGPPTRRTDLRTRAAHRSRGLRPH